MAQEWGYSQSNGPATWATHVEAARGSSQSPIDIIPKDAVYDAALKNNPFVIKYKPENAQKLINTGHSVQVLYDSKDSSLTGGPLTNKFQVAQFHFHWGKSSDRGSEHTVDGKTFAAEGHIVHYNSENYGSFGDAVSKSDGLCVLGFFFKVGKEHSGLKALTDQFGSISHKGDSVELASFDPACLLPEDRNQYWTYPGSLTTPPCFESVTWVVFKQPIEVSEEQLEAFRHIHGYQSHDSGSHGDDSYSHGDHGVVNNYRPTQPVNMRKINASFNELALIG